MAPRFAPRWPGKPAEPACVSACSTERRRSESNRRIEVLQTSALPLGYGAGEVITSHRRSGFSTLREARRMASRPHNRRWPGPEVLFAAILTVLCVIAQLTDR